MLASASPRRLELLRQVDIVPDVIDPANLDEAPRTGELPPAHAMRLAEEKARAVISRHAGAFILAADTVVFVFEGDEVEWIVDGLVDEPFQWDLLDAVEEWRPLLDGHPRVARVAYSWQESLRGAGAPK